LTRRFINPLVDRVISAASPRELFRLVTPQAADQNNSNRPLDQFAKFDFGIGKAKQRQSRPFFCKQIETHHPKKVANAPARQNTENLDRVLRFDRRNMCAKEIMVDRKYAHGVGRQGPT
jgi:hypothetical protein